MSPASPHARVAVEGSDTATDLVPEIMLPAQLDDLRKSRTTPEHRLMLAVLEDAVHAYQLGCESEHVGQRRLFHETEQWFASDDATSPFSFVVICQVFGLEPDYLRAGLRRWSARRRADVQRGSRTIPFRIRRVSGSRHQVTMSRATGRGA